MAQRGSAQSRTKTPCRVYQHAGLLCYGRVCPRIRRRSTLNAGILGSVHWWLPGWQTLEWKQKNMSGRALALQIGSEMAPSPCARRVN